MADINRVILVGRLTRDAELKYTGSGYPVCTFSIAVNRRRKNGDIWEDEASFFDIVLWGKAGEALNQYLVKGKQVGIDGELRQNRWEQDGQPRSRVEVVAMNVQLLGGGYSQGQGNYGRPASSNYQNTGQNYQKQQSQAESYEDNYDASDLDNIPF
ncbi:MAG: single-stranded DNA-binding protein [Treponemataceae bacterium]